MIKKLLIPLLALILCTACTKREELEPIRLYTSIFTRAATEQFDGTSIRIAHGNAPGHYTDYWDGVVKGDEIVLTPEQYYPIDGSTVYLCSYCPPVPLGKDGLLTCKLTGSEDLMAASEVSGSLTKPFTKSPDKVLTHNRLLTQLKFKACKQNASGEAGRLYTIRVNEAFTTATLNLATGKVAFSNPDGMALTPGADATPPGIEIPADGSAVTAGALLLSPFASSDGYTLDVESSFGTISKLKLTAEGAEDTDFAAGVSHEVTLWFSDTGLGILSVTSTDWESVEVGGNIELQP